MKLNKRALLSIIWLCSLTAAVFAQKTLEKPYQKWSRDEAMKVLSDSPWAQTYQSAEFSALAAQQQSAREQSDQRVLGRSASGRVERQLGVQPIVVRLNSALPVRQALVRLQQIAAGYDKMNDEQQSKFNASTKDYLSCRLCQNFYVVTLTKFVLSSGQGVDDGMFQSTKFDELKGKVKLVNDKGEQRELAQFIAPQRPGESAVFLFLRNDDKKTPLVTVQSKQVALIFEGALLNSQNPYVGLLPRRFEFKAAKFIDGENVVF